MPQEVFKERNEAHATSPTLRDIAAVIFRQKRVIAASIVVVLAVALASGVLVPTYEARMKILARRERVDPIVTSQKNEPAQFGRDQISEAELNSEVELLTSHDLLRKTALAAGLHTQQSSFFSTGDTEELRIAKAVRTLAARLKVEPLRKTNIIEVKYTSRDPQLAASVLNTVARLYLEKHLAVHRPSGDVNFFDQQAGRYSDRLNEAEGRLTEFTQKEGIVFAQVERDAALQKLTDFQASANQAHAQIAEVQQRIRALETQSVAIPPRTLTQVRTADNPHLLQQMKSTLLNLELKRTELLSKFEPTYRPVLDLEKQISETRAAIAAEEKSPVRDETTDKSSTYEWVQSELAKARTELSGLKARAAATDAIAADYGARARNLQEKAVLQQNLLRAAQTQEENFLLYQRKEEEARINEALDQRGILNVAIAEQATVPSLPTRSPLLYGLSTLLLAGTASLLLAFTADFLDPSFRTPDEVTHYLGSPVLAAIPAGRKN